MKHFELLLVFGLMLADGLLPAQTARPADKSSSRYLFILETSSVSETILALRSA